MAPAEENSRKGQRQSEVDSKSTNTPRITEEHKHTFDLELLNRRDPGKIQATKCNLET
jgi:hypothetical protein